ncbi:hypothetical protein KDA_73280 [Dictyobacter alpinus]|uniref:DUF1579 domain-containing protein n=1 Tax=Dictyobacter alpinus TaxID=2014873 RepID=A0A402BKG7_9CHLR|nr:hypothetical protein [Dictyobacter alpinus]GCE31844.1 hypothetical protein KDA_73280 [Dictyobacter alpinus]
MSMKLIWKKGRGKLGILTPLIGTWHTLADTPQGAVLCTRSFQKVLNGSYIELTAIWHLGENGYEERAFFGCDAARTIRFWSFTSDGKQSSGEQTDTIDIHPEALGFIAQMPAGIARQIYWPDETQGFHWAVESQTKKGWKRFVEHHYISDTQPITSPEDAPLHS